jgi:hypothetical protein
MDFDPIGFDAFAADGLPGSFDLTVGQLNFSVNDPNGIPFLLIDEGGDYDLAGFGGAATQVTARLNVRVEVTEVGGQAIVPIKLFDTRIFQDNLTGEPEIGTPWSLESVVNLANFGHVTRIDVVVDNHLFAQSEQNSVAHIVKKDFQVFIPEPSTAALAAIGLLSLVIHVGRRRR